MQHIPWAKARLGTFRYNLADSAIAPPDLVRLGLPDGATYPGESLALADELGGLLGNHFGAPGGRVLVTAGASEAIAVTFAALLEHGDEVLVERPGYEPHAFVPPVFGLRVRGFDRPLQAVPGELAGAVREAVSPGTRLVVLTDLHNPSGVRLPDADAEELEALAEERDLQLFVDETFRDLSDRPIGTIASRGVRWVTSGSLTKSYGLGGMRVGWVAGADTFLARAAEAHNALSARPAGMSLALTRDLLPHLATLIERARKILSENGKRWAESIERGRGVFTASASESTVTWCDFGAEGAGDDFARLADEQFELGVSPGRFFGDTAGVRVSLGREPDAFAEAADAWDRAVAAYAEQRSTRETV